MILPRGSVPGKPGQGSGPLLGEFPRPPQDCLPLGEGAPKGRMRGTFVPRPPQDGPLLRGLSPKVTGGVLTPRRDKLLPSLTSFVPPPSEREAEARSGWGSSPVPRGPGSLSEGGGERSLQVGQAHQRADNAVFVAAGGSVGTGFGRCVDLLSSSPGDRPGMMNHSFSCLWPAPIHVKIYGVQGGRGRDRRSLQEEAPAPKRGKGPDDLSLEFAFQRKKADDEGEGCGRQRQRSFQNQTDARHPAALRGRTKQGRGDIPKPCFRRGK